MSCHDERCHCHEHHEHHEQYEHHEHAEGHCCEHCEAKLHGENKLEIGTLIRAGLSALMLILLAVWRVEGWQRFVLYLIPYILIGYDVLWDALKNMLHGRVFDEQFLMTVATLGALAIAEYPEAVAVMLFYQLGEFFQDLAVGKSRRSIAALMDIRPDVATVIREGEEHVLSPEEVDTGEQIVIRAGERIPLDGVIEVGETTVNNAALTGESLPQERAVGDRVVSGGLNMSGVIYVRVESRYHDSTVSKILELVEHSAEKKARIEGFVTRFSRLYTPIVVALALALAVLPPLFLGNPAQWVYRALSFLVVSCPCALVISVPLSFFGGIGGASSQGVLVKGAGYLEQLARVDTVAFDKTGTLTKGSFTVTQVVTKKAEQSEVLRIAAALETFSNHPIAQSILRAHGTEVPEATEVKEWAGKGVTGVLEGDECAVGNATLMRALGVDVPLVSEQGSVVYVAVRGAYLGHLVVRDEVKQEAATALASLRECGVKRLVMLTGDAREIAETVGKGLEITEVHAELLPHQKVERLEALLGARHCVAFVGDGINDAPVLARADVGIAMGGIGSDAAIESADVVLMEDRLARLSAAIRIARKTMHIVRQNIAFALLTKGVILMLAAFGLVNMWISVFGDVGVMLIAILNAMRAIRTRS